MRDSRPGSAASVVPGIRGVRSFAVGPKETLEFRQLTRGASEPWTFFASNMSDGTLRALGVLVALFQTDSSGRRRPLVAIEEPELALHPAAAGVLLDSLRDAATQTQVLVTSHSPDLLDDEELPSESVLAVVASDGVTRVGPLDEAGRTAMLDRLYTAGELLRLDQHLPALEAADNSADPEVPDDGQLRLFDEESPEGEPDACRGPGQGAP